MANPRKGQKSGKKNRSARSGGSNPKRSVTLGLLFPDRVFTRMTYGDVVARAPALAVVDERQFRLNSTFDPDLTGGGHQPMGRDQLLGTIYGKYRVHSVSVHVELCAQIPGFVPCLFYICPSNDTTALTSSLSAAIEQPMSLTQLRNSSVDMFPTVLQRRYNLWDVLGRTKQQYVTDDLTGSVYTTDPVEQILLKIGCMSADATAVVIWQFKIRLDMVVECYDRFTQSQS